MIAEVSKPSISLKGWMSRDMIDKNEVRGTYILFNKEFNI